MEVVAISRENKAQEGEGPAVKKIKSGRLRGGRWEERYIICGVDGTNAKKGENHLRCGRRTDECPNRPWSELKSIQRCNECDA